MTMETIANSEAVAIIGIGCRFPGGADNPARFWQLLRDGRDATIEMPEARRQLWPKGKPIVPARGGFLHEPIADFDSAFFRIAPREASFIDPQQRLLLEVSWEALEDAGCDPQRLAGSSTGVFVGLYAHDYEQRLACELESPGPYFGTGTSAATASGRLSYFYDFRGPALSIDTASSSSLVAVHLACRSLLSGESQLALAAGVNLILSPALGLSFTAAGMLAEDGRSKGFDRDADGFGRGEGCGVVVLKCLSQALHDGDRVLAIIRGSAINQDGASAGLTAPSEAAQAAVLQQALSSAGLTPREITYVEAHGAGTPIGDPIEGRAIGAVYGAARSAPLWVGSVKSNLGHLEAAAGIAGLIKTVLALRNDLIPAHLHFHALPPALADLPLQIPTVPTPWPRPEGGLRRAGVSAFGFGGTNAHLIVEEAPHQPAAADISAASSVSERPCQLLLLSARDEPALFELAGRYEQLLSTADRSAWADICFTSHLGRSALPQQLAIIADSASEAQAQLEAWRRGCGSPAVKQSQRAPARPQLGFLFTGSSAQYPGMGRALYEASSIFRDAIDRCDALLRPLWGRSLVELLYDARADRTCLDETQYQQPAIFAVSYALTALFGDWGIEADVVCGHSLGEYAAACAAGVLRLEDALFLVVLRSRLIQSTAPGEMIALRTSEAQARAVLCDLAESITLSVVNGPESVVLSGAKGAVRAALERLPGVDATILKIAQAYHSPLMDPILAEFGQAAQKLAYAPPQRRFVSSLLGAADDAQVQTSAYWQRHIRDTVRFGDALQAMREAGVDLFLELGPKPTLSGIGKETYRDAATWLPSLQPPFADWEVMLQTLAELHQRGFSVNWARFERDHAAMRRRVALPSYPFQRQRYFLDDASQSSTVTAAAPPPIPATAARSDDPIAHPPSLAERSSGRDAPTAWLPRVLSAPDLERQALIERFLEATVRQVLRLRATQQVPLDRALCELGIDSLMATELRSAIRNALAIPVAADRLKGSISLQGLALLLAEKLSVTSLPESSPRQVLDAEARPATDLEEAAQQIPQLHAVVLDQRQRQVNVGGRWYADFASVNYLGVDLLPEIMDAIPPAVQKWGIHPSWSRTFATMNIYEELEADVAELMGANTTLVFPAVTLLHAGLMPLLAGYDGVIFKDIAAHRSIAESCRLAQADGAECVDFQNNDVADLEQKLARYPLARTKLIAIDGIYSMSGLYPPLPAYAALARRYNARIYIDDAHGTGLVGENPTPDMPYGHRGNGIVKYYGLDYAADRIIYVGSLSKAFASMGAFVTCVDEKEREQFRSCWTYIFSGPAPIASAATARKALALNKVDGEKWRAHIYKLTRRLVQAAREMGFEVLSENYFPIVGIMIGKTEHMVLACQIMWEHGILMTPALFPIVPRDRGLLRFSVTGANTDDEVTQALLALEEVRRRLPELGMTPLGNYRATGFKDLSEDLARPASAPPQP